MWKNKLNKASNNLAIGGLKMTAGCLSLIVIAVIFLFILALI